MESASKQYTLVKEAREVFFSYCETIAFDKYQKEINSFGRGSMRNTHAHVANTYFYWIGQFALKKNIIFIDSTTINSVEVARDAFLKANKLIDEFIEKFYQEENEPITNTLLNRGEVSATPLALFTHVITHEFHHKGQMVSMSRILGYTPPDTDLIRF